MDEFDEPCRLEKSYCPQVSLEEYEEQTLNATEMAIKGLLSHLEQNPEEYTRVLKKKRKQEAEDAGWVSYAKVNLKDKRLVV